MKIHKEYIIRLALLGTQGSLEKERKVGRINEIAHESKAEQK